MILSSVSGRICFILSIFCLEKLDFNKHDEMGNSVLRNIAVVNLE